jgi:hypothetical protein
MISDLYDIASAKQSRPLEAVDVADSLSCALTEAPLPSEAPCALDEKVTPAGSCEATKFKMSISVLVFLRQMLALTMPPCGTPAQITLSPVSVYPDAVVQFVAPVTPVVTAKRFVIRMPTEGLFWIVSWVAVYATPPAIDIVIKAIAILRSLTSFGVSSILIFLRDASKLTGSICRTVGLLRLSDQNHP